MIRRINGGAVYRITFIEDLERPPFLKTIELDRNGRSLELHYVNDPSAQLDCTLQGENARRGILAPTANVPKYLSEAAVKRAKIAPVMDDGELVGWKLTHVPPDHILGCMDMRDGDVVEMIATHEGDILKPPATAEEFYATIQTPHSLFNVLVNRDGEDQVHLLSHEVGGRLCAHETSPVKRVALRAKFRESVAMSEVEKATVLMPENLDDERRSWQIGFGPEGHIFACMGLLPNDRLLQISGEPIQSRRDLAQFTTPRAIRSIELVRKKERIRLEYTHDPAAAECPSPAP